MEKITSKQISVIAFLFLASFSISTAASLDGIPGADQEVFSDGGSAYWPHAPVHVRRSVQYCGARLVDAIRNLCKGNTYAPLSRRSDPTLLTSIGNLDNDEHDSNSNSIDVSDRLYTNEDNYWENDNDLDLMWPQNGKSLALRILTESAAHQRFRRTITNECCKKPCTAMEMVKYCGSPRRSGSANRSS